MAIIKITEKEKVDIPQDDASLLITQKIDGQEKLRRTPLVAAVEKALPETEAFTDLSQDLTKLSDHARFINFDFANNKIDGMIVSDYWYNDSFYKCNIVPIQEGFDIVEVKANMINARPRVAFLKKMPTQRDEQVEYSNSLVGKKVIEKGDTVVFDVPDDAVYLYIQISEEVDGTFDDYSPEYVYLYKSSKYTVSVPFENGSILEGNETYSESSYNRSARSAFVKSNGARALRLNPDVQYESAWLYMYDASYHQIGEETKIINGYSYVGVCEYVRVVFVKKTISGKKVIIANCDIEFIGCSKNPIIVKKPRTADVEYITYKVSDDVCTTSRLMLPKEYNDSNSKYPLILWLDGSGNFTNWNDSFNTVKLPYLKYLTDEGFAVLSIFGWGNTYAAKYQDVGMAHPYPTPTNLSCLKKGIEYVCDVYNIDVDNIHIMSKSQGGQCALYFASHPIVPLKSIGMFAPVVDYLSMSGEDLYADTRKAISDEMGFENDTAYRNTGFNMYSSVGKMFARANAEKLCGMNEAWSNLIGGTLAENVEKSLADGEKFWSERYWENPSKTDIYTEFEKIKLGSVPVKIWGASDDDQTPYLAMVEVAKQLQNGGCEAHMRTMDRGTGGHGCADVGTVRRTITARNGVTTEDIPIGWVENVEWMRSKMPR